MGKVDRKILWAVVGAPISEEIIFRFIPYSFFYLATGRFWEIGIISSIFFALVHWHLGRLFTIVSFFAGLLYWWSMVSFGLIFAILVHSLVNIIDLKIGVREKILHGKFTL